jgi:glyoxylase-like metal-dependent hydrolase (beta-lactamase superfamily II)
MVVVDPGDESEKIFARIREWKPEGRVKFILHTHGHFDHVGGTAKLRELLGQEVKIGLHRGDEPLYTHAKVQAAYYGMQCLDPVPLDFYVEDGQVIEFGRLRMTVIHTQGHTPGGVGYHLHGNSELGVREVLFSGDTLFHQCIGRTDLPGSDHGAIIRSIKEKLFVLNDDLPVYPGHEESTTIGEEKSSNPFV